MKKLLLLLTLLTLTACAAPAEPLDDAAARDLLTRLADTNPVVVDAALEELLAAADVRFVGPLVELIRAREIGLVISDGYVDAARALSGADPGGDWFSWAEWYGAEEHPLPPGFTDWKGQLYARVDPAFADFLRDDLPTLLRPEEIQWGGVAVEGIPALDQPPLLTAAEARYLDPAEPVVGVLAGGEARAYPLRIIDAHEMANDVIGGVPVTVAYCTLCGAAIAFRAETPAGGPLTFGTSGLLYRSNKLMFDRQTRTLWNQLSGEPVMGPLLETPFTLDLLPTLLTSWADWRAAHPQTLVLDVDTGYAPADYYTPGGPYADYYASAGAVFPVWQRSDLLDEKEQVYALRLDGVPAAYPLDLLAAERVVNDAVGAAGVVVIAFGEVLEVRGSSELTGLVRYDAGLAVRAYGRAGQTFRPGPDEMTLLDEAGSAWRVTEEALLGPAGETLARLPGHQAYWFGWFAFFPQTRVYGIDN